MSNEAERQAIEQLLLNVALPIIVQDKGRFGIVGTATLFTIQNRPFLITAGQTILGRVLIRVVIGGPLSLSQDRFQPVT
jgi:hypothetical protein